MSSDNMFSTIIAKDTGQPVRLYTLLVLKHSCKLEALGMTRSRRPSATVLVKRIFGLPKYLSKHETLKVITDAIEEQKQLLAQP